MTRDDVLAVSSRPQLRQARPQRGGSGRDDDRGALVEAAYHVGQQLAARLREREICDAAARSQVVVWHAPDFSQRSVQWPTKTT